jgi:soluble lytic murein transglycosylase-like protein
MQVMPFWSGLIGDGEPSRLFDMRTNLRYGCTILRHYLDMERGDLFRRAPGPLQRQPGRPEHSQRGAVGLRKWSYRPAAPTPTAPGRVQATAMLSPR